MLDNNADVQLTGKLLQIISAKNVFRFPVKFIASSGSTSIVDIRGHRLRVPFLLMPGSYTGELKNGKLFITPEKNKNILMSGDGAHQEKERSFRTQELSDDKSIMKQILAFFQPSDSVYDDSQIKKNQKKQKLLFNPARKNFIFLVTMPVFTYDCEVCLSVFHNKRVRAAFYFDNAIPLQNAEVMRTQLELAINKITENDSFIVLTASESEFNHFIEKESGGVDYYA